MWKRIFSKNNWRRLCWARRREEQISCDAVQSNVNSSKVLPSSLNQNETVPVSTTTISDITTPATVVAEEVEKMNEKTKESIGTTMTTTAAAPLPQSRPPLAVRAVTHTAATGNSIPTRVGTTPPPGLPTSASLVQQSAPPHPKRPSTSRAVSYSSTNSRHRRSDMANLPPIQRILHEEDIDEALLMTSVIPVVTIDRVQCQRAVSALADPDMDDFFDLSSSSSSDVEADDDVVISKDDNDEASLSPVTVIKPLYETEQLTRDSTTTTPDWMLAWAHGEAAVNQPHTSTTSREDAVVTPSVDSVQFSDNEEESSATSSLVASIQYLPVEPLPHLASTDAVFCVGWAAVFWNDNDSMCCSDEQQDAVPDITPQCLFYVQLVVGAEAGTAALRLTPAACSNRAKEMPLTREVCWNVFPVSNRAGNCLTLQSATDKIFILPVHLSARCLEKAMQAKQLHNHFFALAAGSEDEFTVYAPQAQYDAVVYLQFSIDAALRSVLASSS